jgi:parallel beta-helix repeat protein
MRAKIIGIFVFMLFIVTIFPVSGKFVMEKPISPLSSGNILYVGGSGPGNYTKIQDAIDASSNGDTIYVYDDSSPYYENLLVDKSISIIGENRDTTIIDGRDSVTVIYVHADDVTIAEFTIQNSKNDGILIAMAEDKPWDIEINNAIIYNNIIKNVSRGIFGITLQNGKIYNNKIEDISTGIKLSYSSNNNVSYNYITNAKYRGITITSSFSVNKIFDKIFGNIRPPSENNMVFRNIVENNRWGINIVSSDGTKVYDNGIINNHETGLNIHTSTNTMICRNNFVQTDTHNGYQHSYFNAVNRFSQYNTNSWDENFWSDKTKQSSVQINGFFDYVVSIPIGYNHFAEFEIFDFPLKLYDRNPAQEPYEW